MSEQELFYREKLHAQYGRTLVYDPDNQMFLVGNGSDRSKTFSLVPRDFWSAIAGDVGDFNSVNEKDVPLGLVKREQPYFLVQQGFDTDVMPALRKYLESLSPAESGVLREQVSEVIGKTVELFGVKARRDDGGFMGISVRLKDRGNFILTTIGNCACLGPDMYRTRHDQYSSDFPQVYGLHNADMPWQSLSLYAGLGAMAWYAEIETAKDL